MLTRIALSFLQICTLIIALTSASFAQTGFDETKQVSLRLQWKHQFEFAGFYAAKELGYYRDAGLEVDFLEYENGVDIISEVGRGDVEFGIWGSGIIERGMQGDPVVLLANYFKRSPLALATHPDIRFPSELEGKTLMVSSTDTSSANYTQMFQTFNVDRDKINFIPPTFDLTDFENGSVDGVSIFLTNETYLLKKRGIPHNIIDPNNYGVELYDVNLFTSTTLAEQNPQLVNAFIEASNRGWAYALEHPQEIIDLILDRYNSLQKTPEHLTYEAQQTARMIQPKTYPIGSVDPMRIRRLANLFTEVGLSEQNLPASFIFQGIMPEIDLTAEERAFISTHPVVKVAMMPDFTPFSFIQAGKPQGFEHDLLDELSQKTGLRFEPRYGIWNQGLSAFIDREVDLIASISYKPERTDFTLFTEPYYEIPVMIYVRDDFGSYTGLDSLNGKRVGILRDVFYAKDLEEMGTMDLVIYETYEELTKALVFGQIDALMQNLTNIDALIRENAYTNLRLAGELQLSSFKKEDLRFGVRSDQPLLHSIIEKGLEAISQETRFEIANRWLGSKANEVSAVRFTREEREYIDQKGALKLCIDPNWMPLEAFNEQGRHEGISAEIYRLLAQNSGLKFELVRTQNWQETLDAARNRRCDLLSMAMRTEERAEYLDFTLPYASYPFVVATLDHQQFIDDLGILNGKKLATISGFAAESVIEQGYPGIEVIGVDSLMEGVSLVRKGEVYGYVDALPVLAYAIRSEGLTDLYIAGKLDQEFALSAAIRNDEPILLSIMQRTLNSIRPDAIQAINNNWLAVRYESRVDYSLLYKVIAAFAVLALLGLWRHRVIQRTKRIIEEKNQQLEKLAMTDMLTGLYNRHKMDEALKEQLELAERYNTSFAVFLLDIDHFKRINDSLGHNVGDSALVEFAGILRNQTRASDVVGRWGGEEFLIIIPQANQVDLTHMAENLRRKIEQHNFDHIGQITTSLGIAIHHKGERIRELVSRADKALYQSKMDGRNRVTSAD